MAIPEILPFKHEFNDVNTMSSQSYMKASG